MKKVKYSLVGIAVPTPAKKYNTCNKTARESVARKAEREHNLKECAKLLLIAKA